MISRSGSWKMIDLQLYLWMIDRFQQFLGINNLELFLSCRKRIRIKKPSFWRRRWNGGRRKVHKISSLSGYLYWLYYLGRTWRLLWFAWIYEHKSCSESSYYRKHQRRKEICFCSNLKAVHFWLIVSIFVGLFLRENRLKFFIECRSSPSSRSWPRSPPSSWPWSLTRSSPPPSPSLRAQSWRRRSWTCPYSRLWASPSFSSWS